LHYAAQRGHKEIAELLISKGADVNAKGEDGWTPLHEAAWDDRKEIAELLISKGADVNAKNDIESTPLHHAAYYGHKEVAKLLIAKGADVNAKDGVGRTPLHKAVYYGHKEIVGLLLTKGADVNAKGEGGLNQGKTPLDWAIENKHTEIADLLRKHGGKTGEQLEAAKKSIHVAARYGTIEAIKQHLAAGTDVNAKDKYGRTPLDVANNKETVDLLRKHGGRTAEELALMPRLVQHGRFAFSFDAKKGKVYEVQDSFDLLNWEVIKTYTGSGASVRFDEERDHDPPQWFYRVRVVE
jgi:ankyrin repeat protein